MSATCGCTLYSIWHYDIRCCDADLHSVFNAARDEWFRRIFPEKVSWRTYKLAEAPMYAKFKNVARMRSLYTHDVFAIMMMVFLSCRHVCCTNAYTYNVLEVFMPCQYGVLIVMQQSYGNGHIHIWVGNAVKSILAEFKKRSVLAVPTEHHLVGQLPTLLEGPRTAAAWWP